MRSIGIYEPNSAGRGSGANQNVPRLSIQAQGKVLCPYFTDEILTKLLRKNMNRLSCEVLDNDGQVVLKMFKPSAEGKGAKLRTRERYPHQGPHIHFKNFANVVCSRAGEGAQECVATWQGDVLVYYLPDSFSFGRARRRAA